MRIPKRYGQSKVLTCPFCARTATQKNEQGLDVCHQHTKQTMEEFKCTCRSWLEVRSGKFGPYFNCINCGNINYQKGMAMKVKVLGDEKKEIVSEKVLEVPKKRKVTEITTDDVEYF